MLLRKSLSRRGWIKEDTCEIEVARMLEGLTESDFRDTLLSVGRTELQGRPLSPVEVGVNCEKALKAGASRNDIAKELQFTSSTMVTKFLQLQKLAPEVLHLVNWGKSEGESLGFSSAAELSKMAPAHHEAVARNVLKYAMRKTEIVSVRQLFERSGDDLATCIKRVLSRRPVTVVRHIVMGGVQKADLQNKLGAMTQRQRDEVLKGIVSRLYPQADSYSAKLGKSRFTVVGGKSVAHTIAGDEDCESRINLALSEALGNSPKGAL